MTLSLTSLLSHYLLGATLLMIAVSIWMMNPNNAKEQLVQRFSLRFWTVLTVASLFWPFILLYVSAHSFNERRRWNEAMLKKRVNNVQNDS